MKKVLFVPGFRESIDSRDYRKVMKVFEFQGYSVEFVQIDWSKGITNWVDTLESAYADLSSSEIVLAGFSFGAVTAFIAAAHHNPSELWLFSMSDPFSEDLPAYKKSWLKEIGKRRIMDFSSYSFNYLVAKIFCKTFLFIGEKEAKMYPDFKKRIEATHNTIAGSRLFIVSGVGHDVADDRYVESIDGVVKRVRSSVGLADFGSL